MGAAEADSLCGDQWMSRHFGINDTTFSIGRGLELYSVLLGQWVQLKQISCGSDQESMILPSASFSTMLHPHWIQLPYSWLQNVLAYLLVTTTGYLLHCWCPLPHEHWIQFPFSPYTKMWGTWNTVFLRPVFSVGVSFESQWWDMYH